MSPVRSSGLLKALNVDSLATLPHFEALLETQAVDNAPGRTRLVALRNIGPRLR